MRPRVFPAEDAGTRGHIHTRDQASMRPRVFPAEDQHTRWTATGGYRSFNEAAGIPRGRLCRADGINPAKLGFNEAAGIPRGRLRFDPEDRKVPLASMRPRVFPAEDPACTWSDTATHESLQ